MPTLPAPLGEIARRTGARLRRERLTEELDEEMQFHLDMLARDQAAAGVPADEARHAASRRFGNATLLAERSRDMWSFTRLESVWQDLRYGARALRKSASYTLAAVLALAIGIGANTAVFSTVDAVLLRPLAYPGAEHLYTVISSHPRRGPFWPPSYLDFSDWRAQTPSVSFGFARGEQYGLRTADGRVRLVGAQVSDGFFAVLGSRPALGRTFAPEEERPGGPRVVVLSYGLWQSQFGGDRSIVGREVTLDDQSYTVVGVMPAGVAFPSWGAIGAQFWTPVAPLLGVDSSFRSRESRVDNAVIARVSPNVPLLRARAELDAVNRRLGDAYPASNAGWTATLSPLRDQVVGDVAPSLQLFMAAVALVLLIACANVTNLALVRASVRGREMAIRAAIGAGRARVARQLLSESLLLAAAGAALGVPLAYWGVTLLVRAAPAANLPRADEIAVNGRALLFTMGITLLTAILSGVAPAWRASRPNLVDSLKAGGRGTLGGGSAGRLRSALVVSEVALALVLLVGAGLLLRSFQKLTEVPVGFDEQRLVVLRVFPTPGRYDSPDAASAYYRRLADAAASVPGVRAVGLANHLPVGQGRIATRVLVDGRAASKDDSVQALYRVADTRYREALGVPLRAGRWFTDGDMTATSPALVINETLARVLWPNASAVGRRLTVFKQAFQRPDFGQPIEGEVVGVVADTRSDGPAAPPAPEVYVPLPRNVWANITLAIRTTGDPGATLPALRRALLAADSDLPVSEMRPMTSIIASELAGRRLNTALLSIFAAVALLLASTGIYGVIAYSVSERTREIGVRIALGATRGAVLANVVGASLTLGVIGVVLGLVGSAATTGMLSSLLFGVTATDPVVFAGIALLLLAVAALASYLPARRAAAVDPLVALRAE